MRATGTGPAAMRERHSRATAQLGVALQFCACAVALAAAVLVLVPPSTADATFGGRNGLLLMGSVERESPKIGPVARKADCDGRADLWTVRPDGSHLTRIGWGDTGMFSPMGRRVAIDYGGDSCWGYEHDGPDPHAGLFLSRVDGSNRRRIRGTDLIGWLPNGRLIAVGKGGSLVDALTGGQFMTGDGPYAFDSSNALSCSGRVAVARHNELDIFTRRAVHVGGTVRVRTVKRRVVTGPGALDDMTPVWSPDGRSLLFAREETDDFEGPVDLWTVGVDGQGLLRLTDASTSQLVTEDYLEAAWSPDGRLILFERIQVPEPTGLGQSEYGMIMNADGSDQRVFDNSGLRPHIWSPDGGSIAFNGHPLAIFGLTTGRTRHIPYEPLMGPLDWQALGGNPRVACADQPMASPRNA
jgi:hypothetical protein